MRGCRATGIGLIVAALEVAAVPTVHAMIIRHDVPDSEYVVPDGDYPALVDLFGPGDCIGTLVHESYLLTVAHCAMDLDTGNTLPVDGSSHVIADVILHPEWQDVDNYDIALVRFEEPVTGVAPLPIYRGSDEVGSVVTLVGRGVTATGLTGESGAQSDGRLRRATNIVSTADGHFLEIVFEREGEDGLTELEGVGAAGDSGCPVFLEVDGKRYIAGLNSFGEGGNGVGIGEYGSRDYQTRVSTYLEWLDSVVVMWPGDPDPGPGDTGDESGDTAGESGGESDGTGGESDETGSESNESGESDGGQSGGDSGESGGDNNDGGCGCSTDGLPSGHAWAWALLLASTGAFRRRRYRNPA